MNQTRNISSVIFWGICSALILPILILPPNFNAADWNRAILLRIILAILVSFLLYSFFYKKTFSFSIPKWKNPAAPPLTVLFAFLASSIVSTIFSDDLRFSIFGSPTRAGGMLNLLFLVVFIVIVAFLTEKSMWRKFFNVLFSVSVLISIFAVVQYFGILGKTFIAHESGATPSFLGNSTFLAIFMIFPSFLSLLFLIQEQRKIIKIMYSCLLALFLFTILITGSRATYFGMLLGFLFFFLFFPQKLKKVKLAIIVASVLAIALLAYVNLSPKLPSFIENNVKLSQIFHNRLSLNIVARDLLQTRLSAWKITFEAIKEKPLLGWGPENFYIGFEKYYAVGSSNLQKLWWDRAHNIFLDIWVSLGLFSLICYILFWAVLFWKLQRFKVVGKDDQNNAQETLLAHGLQAMFIGYITSLILNFDSFSTYLISFFFVGCALHLLLHHNGEKFIIKPDSGRRFNNKVIFTVFLLLLTLFLFFWNLKPLYFFQKIDRASDLAVIKKCKKSLSIADSSWNKSFVLSSYGSLRYAEIIKYCATSEDEVESSKKALGILKTASQVQPKYTGTWLLMANFTNVLAAREKNTESKNALLQEAMTYIEKAKELSPNRQEITIELEKNYLLKNDYQAMKYVAEECLKTTPESAECHWYLGIAEIFMGEQVNGKKHIEKSISIGGFSPQYLQLGIAYISQKNYQEAIYAYRYLVAAYPENVNYLSILALLYEKVGDYDEATGYVIRVFKLEPDNPETVVFLERLLHSDYSNPLIHTSLAHIYSQIGEAEKSKHELMIAKDLYLNLLAKSRSGASYDYSLAVIYKALGDYENAYQHALSAEKKDPKKYATQVVEIIQSLPPEYLKKYKAVHDYNLALMYQEKHDYGNAYQHALLVEREDPETFGTKVLQLIKSLPPEYYQKYLESHR